MFIYIFFLSSSRHAAWVLGSLCRPLYSPSTAASSAITSTSTTTGHQVPQSLAHLPESSLVRILFHALQHETTLSSTSTSAGERSKEETMKVAYQLESVLSCLNEQSHRLPKVFINESLN